LLISSTKFKFFHVIQEKFLVIFNLLEGPDRKLSDPARGLSIPDLYNDIMIIDDYPGSKWVSYLD